MLQRRHRLTAYATTETQANSVSCYNGGTGNQRFPMLQRRHRKPTISYATSVNIFSDFTIIFLRFDSDSCIKNSPLRISDPSICCVSALSRVARFYLLNCCFSPFAYKCGGIVSCKLLEFAKAETCFEFTEGNCDEVTYIGILIV